MQFVHFSTGLAQNFLAIPILASMTVFYKYFKKGNWREIYIQKLEFENLKFCKYDYIPGQ